MRNRTENNIAAFCAGLLLIIAIALALDANATGSKDDQSQEQDQHQKQHQDQSQSQQQTSEQDQSNQQSMSFSSPRDIEIKRTVAASAPSIDPSHPCALTWSAGLGLTGVGVSGGKAFIDDECNARETARLFYQFGEREKAIMILCAQPSANALASCSPYQDYNKELRMEQLGHDTALQDNERLRRDNEALHEQLEIRRKEYEESVKRCTESFQGQCQSK